MWCILCILAHHVAKSYTKALFVFKLHRHVYNTTRYNIISWLSAYVASFCDMSRVTCHDVTRDMSGVTCHKLQPTHRSFTYVYNNGVPLMFSPKNVICGHFYAVKSLSMVTHWWNVTMSRLPIIIPIHCTIVQYSLVHSTILQCSSHGQNHDHPTATLLAGHDHQEEHDRSQIKTLS